MWTLESCSAAYTEDILNSAVADSVSIIFEINNISNEREKVDAI